MDNIINTNGVFSSNFIVNIFALRFAICNNMRQATQPDSCEIQNVQKKGAPWGGGINNDGSRLTANFHN